MGFIKKVKWPSLDALVERAEKKEMELKDTIDMMTSADYKERFKAEYYQLKIRRDKLMEMVEKWDRGGSLGFKPTCSRETYGFQLYIMDGYLDVLRMRAKLEGVKL